MGNSEMHKVVLISGSLRKSSTNTGLLRAITELNHPSFTFEWIDISKFPVFNEDIVEEKGTPADVRRARDQVFDA